MMRNKRIIAVLIAALVCGTVIVFASARPITALRSASVHIMEPVMRGAGNTGRRISGIRIFSSGSCSGCEENRLGREIVEAKLAQMSAENVSLKRLLGLKQQAGLSPKPADVLLYNQEWGQEWLVIDRGEEDGVRIGDPVVDEERLFVGEVAEIGTAFAKVVIASDKNTALSVGVTPLGDEALAKGLGARAFAITLIPRDAPVHPGDMITRISKSNKAIPALFVGRMVSVDDHGGGAFKTGRATLLVHPERMNRVMVFVAP